ncbi:Glycogen phosphorylase [Mycobacteroides abscessus]|nr:Glycogen phosphorylase [Mycobacteroides abscessus]
MTNFAEPEHDEHSRTGLNADTLQRAIIDHLRYSIGRPASVLTPAHYYRALALAVRDRMQQRWIASMQTYLDLSRKVAVYLSAEFLMGPQLGNNLLNLQIEQQARDALSALGQDIDEVPPARRNRGWATVGLGAWRRATWTRWPPWIARRSVTASAMSTGSSTRRSATDGRSRRPTTGSTTETLGK